jgi:FcoT-like thioesterase domain
MNFSDTNFVDKILLPYKTNCRYLKNVEFEEGEKISAKGSFSVPSSFYIDSTGHLNAVEMNICYNQLCYYLLAKSIHLKLEKISALSDWSLDTFWKHQLTNILIVKYSISFRGPIQPNEFQGMICLDKIFKHDNSVMLKTTFSFHDKNGGLASGTALAAVILPFEDAMGV